ncbi:hypothetical protein ACRRTK_003600 [Alexandromys fortis]
MYTISKEKKENKNFVYVWTRLDGCMYSYAYTLPCMCVCVLRSKDNRGCYSSNLARKSLEIRSLPPVSTRDFKCAHCLLKCTL